MKNSKKNFLTRNPSCFAFIVYFHHYKDKASTFSLFFVSSFKMRKLKLKGFILENNI